MFWDVFGCFWMFLDVLDVVVFNSFVNVRGHFWDVLKLVWSISDFKRNFGTFLDASGRFWTF